MRPKMACYFIAVFVWVHVSCNDTNSQHTEPCGPDTCAGCCDGDGNCRTGNERAFCGVGGHACRICVDGRCEANVCVFDHCDAANCPTGCCMPDGVCLPGTDTVACGTGGASCQACTEGYCEENRCIFDELCGPLNCAGCCDTDGLCRAGTQQTACGRDGEECIDCGNETCQAGECTTQPTCGPHNCAGCCDAAGVCHTGDENTACGAGGNACLSCGTQVCEAGGCVDPPPALRIGMWLSPWRLTDRTPAQYVAAVKGLSYASSVPSRSLLILTICGAATQTTTRCFFTKPAGLPDYSNVSYSTDRVTPILNAVESDGTIEVILDVEPMEARVSDVMRVAMTAFGHYNCVKGFAPDWEWVKEANKISKLPSWNSELQNYKPDMELHLISWETDAFGTWRDAALSFGFDGQSFTGLSQQLWYFNDWTSHFLLYRNGWYWGYDNDRSWTQSLVQNPTQLRSLHDQYRAINPEGMILMATENLFFTIDAWLPTSPMWP